MTDPLLDPADALIGRWYRSALSVPPEQYQQWALRELQKVIPFDGVIWGRGLLHRWHFHTVTSVGLPVDFPERLEATRSINPLIPQILARLGQPVDRREVLDDAAFHQSGIYQQLFQPCGIEHVLSLGRLDRRSGLYSLLSLYRKNLDQPFLAHEKALQSRLVYHLFNAASHAFFLHLANTQGARPADCAAAVVDSELMFGEVQTRFLDLLDQFYPKREPFRLPFALPSEGGEHMDGLSARSQRIQKDLHLVYVWPTSPLDRLTQREREIVYAVAQGLSFKQAARKIGVAPSTVANHLYRVYRKLGVSSRTALAALVYPDSSETPK